MLKLPYYFLAIAVTVGKVPVWSPTDLSSFIETKHSGTKDLFSFFEIVFNCTGIIDPLMGKGQKYIFPDYIYNVNVTDIKEKCHNFSTAKIYLCLSPCPYILISVVVILIQIQS